MLMAGEGWVGACTHASAARLRSWGTMAALQYLCVFQGHQDPKETKAMKGWRVNLVFLACLGCEVRNNSSGVPITLQAFTQSP